MQKVEGSSPFIRSLFMRDLAPQPIRRQPECHKRRTDMVASFPLNWLETSILLLIWAALIVDVMRQDWISQGAKFGWIVFIVLVPIVSWIAYGVVRHRHGVGPGRTR